MTQEQMQQLLDNQEAQTKMIIMLLVLAFLILILFSIYVMWMWLQVNGDDQEEVAP